MVKRSALASLILLISLLTLPALADKATDLQHLVDRAKDGTELILPPGEYIFKPTLFIDPVSGNSSKADSRPVAATVGLMLKGKSISIIGSDRKKVIIRTNAGYGVYVEDCPSVLLKNLTITGGLRDQDGAATCAGVVVRRSRVEIAGCIIRDNAGDHSVTIAGVGGVMGREGALLHIHHNVFRDNTWDAIALYRGNPGAVIHDNVIDGGRGAGIGLTWDSRAFCYRNVITGYWKGIGSFGASNVSIHNNLVRDLRVWGIQCSGQSRMDARNNTVIRMGNIGLAIWSDEAAGYFSHNVVVDSGHARGWPYAPGVSFMSGPSDGEESLNCNPFFNGADADFAFEFTDTEDGWGFGETRDLSGVNGNLVADPLFVDENWSWDAPVEDPLPPICCVPLDASPLLDFGPLGYLDPDGSPRDLGIYGGYYGRWGWPVDGEPFVDMEE